MAAFGTQEPGRVWLALTVAISVALGVRLIHMGDVLAPGETRFSPDDPPYHLLRVQRLLTDPPRPTDPDPLVAWPEGAVAHWPFGFDWLLAGLIRPFVGSDPNAEDVARACSWTIPFLAIILVPLTYALAARWMGRGRALATAFAVGLLPAFVDYSRIGRVDHHVLEPLFPVLMFLGPAMGTSFRTMRLLAGVCGFAGGLAFAFYPIALTTTGTALVLVGFALASWRARVGSVFAVGVLAGTLLSLASSPHPFEWVFYSPSLLQVTLIAIAAVGIGTLDLLASRNPERPLVRMIPWSILSMLVVAGLIAALEPDFFERMTQGFGYLGGGSFNELSQEAQPLLSRPDRAGFLLTYLAPVAVWGVVLLWIRPRGSSPPTLCERTLSLRRAVAAMTLVGGVLALLQQRFLVSWTPFYALALVEGLASIFAFAGARLARMSVMRPLRWAAAATLVLAGSATAIEHLWIVNPVTAYTRLMLAASKEIAAHPGPRPFGVLAPRYYGHLVRFVAGAGVVCDNFYGPPENDAAIRRCFQVLYETDPQMARAHLERLRVAYVVLIPPSSDGVRLDARLMGIPESRFVDEGGRFTPEFARTFQARLGLWATTAEEGQIGPMGLRFVRRFLAFSHGQPAAEVLLFAVPPKGSVGHPQHKN